MDVATVIILVVLGGLALLMLSNFGKDPSRKTTSQLERELALHDRVISGTKIYSSARPRRMEARRKVEEELERRKTVQRSAALANTIMKVKDTIDMFASSINPTKFSTEGSDNIEYYVGYINEVARSIATKDGAVFSDAMKTPIFMELRRITGRPAESRLLDDGPEILAKILKTEPAKLGSAEGAVDGLYVTEPSNPPPYFRFLIKRFDIKIR